MPAVEYPAPGGLSPAALADLPAGVARDNELVGIEITAFDAAGDAADAVGPAALIAEVVAPLLAG